MVNRIIILVLFFTITNLTKVCAGWYECYNFKGKVDKYPISLSIQVMEDYFGEKEKKDFNVIGVYRYDKYNEPIRLEGKFNFQTKKVLLYEITNKKRTATFEFDFSERQSNGVWKNLLTNKILQLQLNYISKLIDTEEACQYSNIEIIQSKTLDNFYFIGIYSKVKGEYKAKMDKLKIVSRNDNSEFQILDFSKLENLVGNVSTPIYDNLEITNVKNKEFTIMEDVGKYGGDITIRFDSKRQKFKIVSSSED